MVVLVADILVLPAVCILVTLAAGMLVALTALAGGEGGLAGLVA